MDDTDKAEWFGLPENIDHVAKRAAADKVVAMLKKLKVATAQRLKFDREMWASALSPILSAWKKLYSVDNKSVFDLLIFSIKFSLTFNQLNFPT